MFTRQKSDSKGMLQDPLFVNSNPSFVNSSFALIFTHLKFIEGRYDSNLIIASGILPSGICFLFSNIIL